MIYSDVALYSEFISLEKVKVKGYRQKQGRPSVLIMLFI